MAAFWGAACGGSFERIQDELAPEAEVGWKNEAEKRQAALGVPLAGAMGQLKEQAATTDDKVDDTVIGIEEGLNAGCWTIGLALSGNYVGLSHDEWIRLPHEEKDKLKDISGLFKLI